MSKQRCAGWAIYRTPLANERIEKAPYRNTLLATRRAFLTGTLAASGLAFSGWPIPTRAQTAEPEDRLKIGEIRRSEEGKLRGTLTILNADRQMPARSGVPAGHTMVRYFEGKNADGSVVWPPADAIGPLPAPTLRARVGDRVEITLLNHVNIGEFELTGGDRADRGEGACDQQSAGSTGEIRYPDKAGDRPPNCFHGSSTANIHFHGTHVTPDGLGDNVLLQLRADPRVRQEFIQDEFEDIFNLEPPARWNDLPPNWRWLQERLLKDYDDNAVWQGVRGALPAERRLWPAAKTMIDAGLWPQYQIGAYPYCFDLTEYAEDEHGVPIEYEMGQCPGTHWYHAHKHGSTAINVYNGMAGVFIIEGDYDDALNRFDSRLKATEKVLIVQNFSDKPNLAKGLQFGPPPLSVNGQLKPTIRMQPGEIQFWRMVNASVRAVTTLRGFQPVNGVAPEVRQIAQDGVQFHLENYRKQPLLRRPPDATPLANTFAPGNRVDILVKAPDATDSYVLRLIDTTNGAPVDLLTIQVDGPPMNPPMSFPTETNYPEFPRFLKDIEVTSIRQWRTLDFGWEPHRSGTSFPPAPRFMINDATFSGERYDQTMVLGGSEEWTLTNSTRQIAHPFHIHVNPFQVVEIFDPNLSDEPIRFDQNFVWHDVIAIPPARTTGPNGTGPLLLNAEGKAAVPGYVKIRHRFVDFPGSYVLHCHMLAHEDRGMMQLVRVIPSGGTATIVPHH